MAHPNLTKLTPPRPARLYPRERLFDLLDHMRQYHRVIWVSAPGGAGKTSLATSYLSARKLPMLWYQVDQGDGDVASFFYYMGLAAQRAAPRHKKPLPLLTPEYLADVPTFARNFFRELYRRLPRNGVIVFDNYQDAPEDSLLHAVLQIAMEEVPEGFNLLVLSRVEPPAVLARLRLCDHAACLDWEKIQLTREETAGLAGLRAGQNPLDPKTIEALHQRTQGWAAGVVLMLEQGRSGATLNASTLPANQKLLFDYFAGEIFTKLDDETQHILLTSGLLPKMTAAMVAQLAAAPSAGRVLEELHRKNYFTATLKHTHSETVYEYHPLFREFLLTRARQTFAPEYLNQAQRQAAALLEADDQIEAAAALWQDARDWTGIAQLSVKHAQSFVAQGRSHTLEGWLRSLPPERFAQMPWLPYWLGVCRMPYSMAEARGHFEDAFARFEAGRDAIGMFLACAGVLDTISYEMEDYGLFDPWLERLDRLLDTHPHFPSDDVEARIVGGVIMAMMWRKPTHPSFGYWLERGSHLLRRCTSVSLAVHLGFRLTFYKLWYGENGDEIDDVLAFLAGLEGRLLHAPLERMLLKHAQATRHGGKGEAERAFCVMEEGIRIADDSGVHVMDAMLIGATVWSCLAVGELARAEELLARMQARLTPHGSKLDHNFYRHLRAWQAALAGEFGTARHHIELAIRLSQELKAVSTLNLGRFCAVEYMIAGGALEAARTALVLVEEATWAVPGGLIAIGRCTVEAQLAFAASDDARGLELVAQVLRLSRTTGIAIYLGALRTALSRFCALALQHDIETDSARAIIRKCRLTPPDDAPMEESWPWPIKIYTLGRFSVVLDDQPLRFQGKAQRRPLELLMALLSFGGRDIAASRLADTLWPDAEGDAAQIAFKATLQRLRKLMGDDEALVLTNNRLSLDSRRVWVDAWAFERSLSRLEPGEHTGAEDEQAALRAFALYHGPFLHDTDSAGWSLAARERLRAKFIGGLAATSARWMQQQRHEETLSLLDRGLAADPLAEEFYRRQMRCHAALGRRAEVMAVYGRCQRVFSAQLRIAPSAETQALYAALRDDRPLPP